MTKQIIRNEQSIYRVSDVIGGVSVSRPVETLAEAKKTAHDTLKFAKSLDKEIEEMNIIFYTWPTWYKGEPEPKVLEKLIWEY